MKPQVKIAAKLLLFLVVCAGVVYLGLRPSPTKNVESIDAPQKRESNPAMPMTETVESLPEVMKPEPIEELSQTDFIPYHDLPVGRCSDEEISYEDKQAAIAWEANHPIKKEERRIAELAETKRWELKEIGTPEAIYALSTIVHHCYNAPRNEEELLAMKEHYITQSKRLKEEGSEEWVSLIDGLRTKLDFCEGRRFPAGLHWMMAEDAAKQGYYLAQLYMVDEVNPHYDAAEPEVSLEYAQMLEESLPVLTYDTALRLGRLYAEAELGRTDWIEGGGFDNPDNSQKIRKSMAYFELSKRIMPALNIPRDEHCASGDNLLRQLHVGKSTAEVMNIDRLSEDLYEKWFLD